MQFSVVKVVGLLSNLNLLKSTCTLGHLKVIRLEGMVAGGGGGWNNQLVSKGSGCRKKTRNSDGFVCLHYTDQIDSEKEVHKCTHTFLVEKLRWWR